MCAINRLEMGYSEIAVHSANDLAVTGSLKVRSQGLGWLQLQNVRRRVFPMKHFVDSRRKRLPFIGLRIIIIYAL